MCPGHHVRSSGTSLSSLGHTTQLTFYQPDEKDRAARTARVTTDSSPAKRFYRRYIIGLILLIFVYATTFGWTSLRGVYSAQFYLLFTGQKPPSWIYFVTDLPGALIAVIIALIKVRDNQCAFFLLLLSIFTGTVIIGLFTALFKYAGFSGFWWMGLNSLGINLVYLTYMPLLFDRLIASCRTPMSAVVLCNTTDGFGQLFGTFALLIGNFVSLDPLSFFTNLGVWISVINITVVTISALFFRLRIRVVDCDESRGSVACSAKLNTTTAAELPPTTISMPEVATAALSDFSVDTSAGTDMTSTAKDGAGDSF